MKTITNITNKYVLAIQAILLAAVFVIAPASAFAQYTYNDDVYGGSDYTYNNDVYGGSDYTYYDVYGGSDYSYSDVYGGYSTYSSYPVTSGSYVVPAYSSYPYSYGSYGYYPTNSTVTSGSFSGGTTYVVTPVYYVATSSTVSSGGYYGGGSNYYYSTGINLDPALSGTCSVSGNANVGSVLTWTATASGGNGFYTFSWSGDEGLSGSGQSISKVYSYAGIKNANVTIYSNGQSITRSCQVNIANSNQVLAYTDTSPLSSVYLSDIPYTGAGDTARMIVFVSALFIWSLAFAYGAMKKKFSFFSRPAVAEVKTENVSSLYSHPNTDNQILDEIDALARENKIILSSDALMRIAKEKTLKGKNPKDIISKLATGEWKAIGEGDIN